MLNLPKFGVGANLLLFRSRFALFVPAIEKARAFRTITNKKQKQQIAFVLNIFTFGFPLLRLQNYRNVLLILIYKF